MHMALFFKLQISCELLLSLCDLQQHLSFPRHKTKKPSSDQTLTTPLLTLLSSGLDLDMEESPRIIEEDDDDDVEFIPATPPSPPRQRRLREEDLSLLSSPSTTGNLDDQNSQSFKSRLRIDDASSEVTLGRGRADVVIDIGEDVEGAGVNNVSDSFGDDGLMGEATEDDVLFLETVETLERQINNVVPSSSSRSHDIVDGRHSNVTDAERRQALLSLKRLKSQDRIFPDVKANSFHTIAFQLTSDYKPGDAIRPFPDTFQSKWENDFIPLPCADQNTRLFKIRLPNTDSDNPEERPKFKEERIWMWSRIEISLGQSISTVDELATRIRRYATIRGQFKALAYCLDTLMRPSEKANFFDNVLPCLQILCLSTKDIVTCPLPLLRKYKNQSISLSQKQIACLLANAFFSTFPKRFSDELQYPTINFSELFEFDDETDTRILSRAQKIYCILHYFMRISDYMPTGVVTFTRKSVRPTCTPKWETSDKKISKIIPLLEGTIETEGAGFLQVDFANQYVGGGVLSRGAVQEEILFVIYPELIVSRLFTERLTSCEALVVTGCERFSKYSGYGNTFAFAGDWVDVTSVDSKGRRCTQFVAIDALVITRPLTQFHPRFLTRELNKAYIGFSSPLGTNVAIATGKWGCGAFRGNPQLKAILQLMAASQAGRDVVFFTFTDAKLQEEIEEMYHSIKDCAISHVWNLLGHYYRLFCTTSNPKYDLCQYLIRYAGESVAATTSTKEVTTVKQQTPIARPSSEVKDRPRFVKTSTETLSEEEIATILNAEDDQSETVETMEVEPTTSTSTKIKQTSLLDFYRSK